MIRVCIAILAIGLMSLSAFAQTPDKTPEENEAARAETAKRVIAGESCANCDLFQTNLSYQELVGRDFSNARLRQADLSLSTLDKAKLANANLSIANGFGIRAEDADFTGANLEDATLVGAWLGGARLTGANLTKANLSGAYLVTALGLSQGQLSAACGDESTELPKGLSVPRC